MLPFYAPPVFPNSNLLPNMFRTHKFQYCCMTQAGSIVAQAVSFRLPTVGPRFESGSSHVGFMVYKAALEQAFSEYFGFH
jgi:hypothetical protein